MDIVKNILTHILQHENCTVALETKVDIATLFGNACFNLLNNIQLIIKNNALDDSERIEEIKNLLIK